MPRKKPLALAERRMFILMECVINSDKYKIKTEREFFKSIRFPPNNKYQIESAGGCFTWLQISTACKVYGVDANWFVDERYIEMIRKDKPANIINSLRATVLLAIDELKQGATYSNR